ncbi:serine/threonine-protein kinase [Streptacidiphilus jiangxiensis]|uniref:non-specific serine/threonine protein kinase n=1 Tax=Streptacidiphilus jiangxiensis TaxID=235985 RepID=A0A1H7MR92_STRJI|nr:serine/threonine-protein kinase [Streptacidiphilus jiangxiensis]SEL13358.1 Serine/threonine protein kinase [Streptacidiphilus jiangxiensis]
MTPLGGTEGSGFDLSGSGAEPLDGDDPRLIGPIPLLGRLGSGGMGRVYLGTVAGRYAAVKQVLPQFIEDEEFQRHFSHELDNLARLPEKVSAPLLLADREARPPWFATAYIPGLTLDKVLAVNGGPLDASRLWLLLREAAAGLKAVHALGMVHRDLKPSNVMLTVDGVALIDFGVARAADQSRLTRTGVVLGTPAYMSPEQANGTGELTEAADIFALGALIAYAAGGRPPFGEGSGVDMLYRIVHTEPDLNALQAVSPDLAEAVAACLDKNPTARPTADRLLQLARQRCVLETPDWPEPVMAPLRARAAFAALPAPDPATLELTTAEPVPTSAAPRHRRRWLTPIVIPLVLTTGVATGLLLVPELSPSHAAAGPGVTGSSGPTTPSASPSAGTHGTTPGTSPNPSPSADPNGTPSASGTPGRPGPTTTAPGGGSSNGNGGNGTTPPATRPTVTVTATPTPRRGPECVLNYNHTACSSNNPTVELQWYHNTNGDEGCTFTGDITWGDGTSSKGDTAGGPGGTYSFLAAHHYASPGTYTISVQGITDSGLCLAFGYNATFTRTS